MEALEQRLRGRGTEIEDAIVTRLGNAKKELEAKDENELFDVNGDLDRADDELKTIIDEDISVDRIGLQKWYKSIVFFLALPIFTLPCPTIY